MAEQTKDEMIAALRLALPYVERVAATVPFEMARQMRQRQAVRDAAAIRAILAAAGDQDAAAAQRQRGCA